MGLNLVMANSRNWERGLSYIEWALIIIPTVFPLFFSLPYRVNIFLSWEGAYRLYLGQIPYQDFGLPLGIGYWIIPMFFFKVFGPYLFTLVKAQVFINLLSLIAFRNILKILDVEKERRILAILVFVLSYSFSNFWPWYNHSVFVFQLVALNFILIVLFSERKLKWPFLMFAAAFSTLSFFTKQDSGALCIVFCSILLLYDALAKKRYSYLAQYLTFTFLFLFISILPFLQYDFAYWFNYGQPPHNSRINIYDFLSHSLGASEWEKFYLLLIVISVWGKFTINNFFKERKFVVLLLIVVGIILQALIIKVTSPLPTGHHTYYHAFAFAFIITNLSLRLNFKRLDTIAIFGFLIMFWWSALYWDYAGRIFKKSPPTSSEVNHSEIQSRWVTSEFKSFEKVLMPEATVAGIQKLLNLEIVKSKKDLKVLNMTELTPLAYEMGFEPMKNQPLWFHLNVGIFEKEVAMLNENVASELYDIVLFQSIPGLDNFFPYAIQNELKQYYQLIDTFEAPRKRSEGYSFIEVYVRKK